MAHILIVTSRRDIDMAVRSTLSVQNHILTGLSYESLCHRFHPGINICIVDLNHYRQGLDAVMDCASLMPHAKIVALHKYQDNLEELIGLGVHRCVSLDECDLINRLIFAVSELDKKIRLELAGLKPE